jgi:hypothetical protein
LGISHAGQCARLRDPTCLVGLVPLPKRILVIEIIRRAHGLHAAPLRYRAPHEDAWLALGFVLAARTQKCYISICSM